MRIIHSNAKMQSLDTFLVSSNVPHVAELILVDYASYADMVNCLRASKRLETFFKRELLRSNVVRKKVDSFT